MRFRRRSKKQIDEVDRQIAQREQQIVDLAARIARVEAEVDVYRYGRREH